MPCDRICAPTDGRTFRLPLGTDVRRCPTCGAVVSFRVIDGADYGYCRGCGNQVNAHEIAPESADPDRRRDWRKR